MAGLSSGLIDACTVYQEARLCLLICYVFADRFFFNCIIFTKILFCRFVLINSVVTNVYSSKAQIPLLSFLVDLSDKS